MCQPWQHFYNSQRLKLSYWSWGSDENPPLILLHGGRDHARTWDRIAAEFSSNYWVLAPDLRGHGDSEWARGSYYATVDHVLDLFNFIEFIKFYQLTTYHKIYIRIYLTKFLIYFIGHNFT